MFRETDGQFSMFEAQHIIPAAKRKRLKKTWAHWINAHLLPAIDEEPFREHYGTTGRPNKSVKVLLVLLLLQHIEDLTDAQVIEHFEFNLLWHHATGVEPAEAHVCQKTLHNFRVLLMRTDLMERVFADLVRVLGEANDIKLTRQRLDSTHITSNIATRTRLGLFVETIEHFMRELKRRAPDELDAIDDAIRARYIDREGYFADAKSADSRRRLGVAAQDLAVLVTHFEAHDEIAEWESFGLLRRLLAEQCIVADGGLIELKPPTDISPDSLQSPHDPDATYGRGGKGYRAQLAETCHPDNPFELVTGAELTDAHTSDQTQAVPMLEKLEANGVAPDEMFADQGYGSGANIVESARMGVELVCPVADPSGPQKADRWLGEDEADAPADEASGAPTATLADFRTTKRFDAITACPAGHAPVEARQKRGRLYARFDARQCDGCPFAESCPARRLRDGGRSISRKPKVFATARRQREQRTAAFKESYRIRSGAESLMAEGKGKHGLARPRVRGRPRMELKLFLVASAINVKRAFTHFVRRLVEVDGEGDRLPAAA